MRQFKDLNQVWAAIDQGLTVYWSNDAYQLTIENAHSEEYRLRMGWDKTFSQRDDKALRVTCMSNYFGSFLGANEISSLYTKKAV